MKKQKAWMGLIAGVAFLGGWGLGFFFKDSQKDQNENEAKDEAKTLHYTCSMHPQIQQPMPGKCPICGMDLISVSETNEELGQRELRMSARAMKLAEVESVPVARRFVKANVRMVGKVTFDETRLATITAWVPGRLDRLYVDYTGLSVRKGDHLVELFSPELLQAQEELIGALAMANHLEESKSALLLNRRNQNIASAREKLRLWGLSQEQVQAIEQRGEVADHITINSPIAGVVVHKNAIEGMYVQTGSPIYTIADLSNVWVKLDAYESDLPWLRYGQSVAFETEAYPGEIFTGQIAIIDPMLNPTTRTVKLRVNLPNPEGRLKPDMFVRASVKSNVAAGGLVMDPSLSGKWISPMHPEIVKEAPGACDICGMALVSAESLGYVSAEKVSAPLLIPASAPLITGRRAVVYVDHGEGRYEGREVVLGARAGDDYLVESGLKEGEKVVIQGNFKIDSAIQILAKPSMMNPIFDSSQHHKHSTKAMHFPISKSFKQHWIKVLMAYESIRKGIAQDAFSKDKLALMQEALETMALENEAISGRWDLLMNSIDKMKKASNENEEREAFAQISDKLIEAVKAFGSGDQSLFQYHCPMAFEGRGADWLQVSQKIENPYFGSAMSRCGRLVETISRNSRNEMHTHQHEE